MGEFLSHRAVLQAALMMAPHFQGGHSDTGRYVASALNIPFPITMDDLRKKAKALDFRESDIWPWFSSLSNNEGGE
jgi:hypothetical protein